MIPEGIGLKSAKLARAPGANNFRTPGREPSQTCYMTLMILKLGPHQPTLIHISLAAALACAVVVNGICLLAYL